MPIVVEDHEMINDIIKKFNGSEVHDFLVLKNIILGKFFDYLNIRKSMVEMYLNVLDPNFDSTASDKREIEYFTKIIGKISATTSFADLLKCINELLGNNNFIDSIELQNAIFDYNSLYCTMTPKSGSITSSIHIKSNNIFQAHSNVIESTGIDLSLPEIGVDPQATQFFYNGLKDTIGKLFNALKNKWNFLLEDEKKSIIYPFLYDVNLEDTSFSLKDLRISLEDMKIIVEKIIKKYYPNELDHKKM